MFNLSKVGVPTLTKYGHIWADLRTTRNGLFLLSGRTVLPVEVSVVNEVAKSQALSVGSVTMLLPFTSCGWLSVV